MAEKSASSRGGGRGFRFWKKSSSSSGGSGSGKPADASKTGCGGLFKGRRGKTVDPPEERRTTAPQQQAEAPNGRKSSGPRVQITFDDVELPDAAHPPAVAAAAAATSPDVDSDGSSVHSICEEIVCVKVKQAESAWVRPPVAAAPKEKPKMALSKMASRDGGTAGPPAAEDKNQQPRRPSADRQVAPTEPPDEADAERQRVAEARFQRRSVDMRNVKAKGGVKIEQSPQSEMWWNIVNKSLVGTGLFVRAVACSLQSGGIYACNPAEFAPTADQVAALRDNFQNPAAFAAAGFAIGGTIYKVEPDGCTREMLSAVNLQHTEGLLVVKSQTAVLIGGFAGSRDQARETLCDMRDLFVSQGL